MLQNITTVGEGKLRANSNDTFNPKRDPCDNRWMYKGSMPVLMVQPCLNSPLAEHTFRHTFHVWLQRCYEVLCNRAESWHVNREAKALQSTGHPLEWVSLAKGQREDWEVVEWGKGRAEWSGNEDRVRGLGLGGSAISSSGVHLTLLPGPNLPAWINLYVCYQYRWCRYVLIRCSC